MSKSKKSKTPGKIIPAAPKQEAPAPAPAPKVMPAEERREPKIERMAEAARPAMERAEAHAPSKRSGGVNRHGVERPAVMPKEVAPAAAPAPAPAAAPVKKVPMMKRGGLVHGSLPRPKGMC